ncbi:MAG: hypothetical protein ACI9ES_001802 [Oceanospirillaceae bacterium]|jgi:hypothetical protein
MIINCCLTLQEQSISKRDVRWNIGAITSSMAHIQCAIPITDLSDSTDNIHMFFTGKAGKTSRISISITDQLTTIYQSLS